MQTLERLGADDLLAVVTTYRQLLQTHREMINLLNVYPVPDGDTGTNMALTLDSVVKEIEARRTVNGETDNGGHDLVTVAQAISHGSLMGARGNSGVILSQILRGLAGVFTDVAAGGSSGADGRALVRGLQRATEGAYLAVGNPVEGTILTVMRAAAEAAATRAEELGGESGLVEVLDAARHGAAVALSRTPELLPILKAAGVVDSGGTGLLLLFDAALHVVDGRPLPEPPAVAIRPFAERDALAALTSRPAEAGAGGSDVLTGPRYEVMYLLEAADGAIAEFRNVWAGVGDSIVVVGGDGLYNCHIHTDDIGAAIEAALDAGRPRQIRVSDLVDQVQEERWVREAVRVEDPVVEPVTCAVVAVCNGDGVRRIFHSLGVTTTVSGGQSMNPSTADVLAAIEAAPSDEVIVLPNNRNITAVAEAAAAASAKTVVVVPTAGIPEGFAALLEYDPQGDAAANAQGMANSAARVVAGEVTRAVRETAGPGVPILVGDWLGLSRRGIETVAPGAGPSGAAEVAIALLGGLIDDAHHEIATLIVGDGAQAAETRAITEWLAETWPTLRVEVHQGGQPLYPYLVSIE